MKTGDGIRAKKSSLAGLNNMGRERLTNRLANMGRGDMANMEMGEEWQNINRGMIPRF